jgi:hypothetical protein
VKRNSESRDLDKQLDDYSRTSDQADDEDDHDESEKQTGDSETQQREESVVDPFSSANQEKKTNEREYDVVVGKRDDILVGEQILS